MHTALLRGVHKDRTGFSEAFDDLEHRHASFF